MNAFCNFLKQISYPADLIVKTYIANPSRVGVDTFNVISLSTDPDTVYANGGATMVWVDFINQKAAPWPPEIKAKFDL